MWKTAELVAQILGRHMTTVLDVGARSGSTGQWWRIPPLANLVGFEPEPVECRRLNAVADNHERYEAVLLGSRCGLQTFHITESENCSSIYPPRAHVAERYSIRNAIKCLRQEEMPITTLDAWAAAAQCEHDISFIKLDVQGASLDVLRGGTRVLDNCLGVETEVEFSPLYEGQPLFADVDAYLRERGLYLWRLSDLCHYQELRHGRVSAAGRRKGRLFWANATYLRDHVELPLDAQSVRPRLILAALLDALEDSSAAYNCLAQTVAAAESSLPPESINLLTSYLDRQQAALQTKGRRAHRPKWLSRVWRKVRCKFAA